MDRLLLTGATGFVGRHAGPALEARGYEVHAVARRTPLESGGVRWHACDLLDGDQIGRLLRAVAPSHLLHLAWYAEPGLYWESPQNDRWLHASVELLRAFAAAGGRRAVVAGTCAEYDWGHGARDMSEHATPLAPRGAYGVAKDSLRRELERWSVETGASACWARLFFLFGEAEDPRRLVPSVARSLLSGRPAETSAGGQVRDFLLSSQAADALAALLDAEVTGPVNVGSGIGVSVRDLVELIGEAAGRPELLRPGALPERPDEPPRIVADTTRLGREVGWRPAGEMPAWVGETVAWWRDRLGG